MSDEPMPERRFLGVVEVDSGTLLLGDPAYCLPGRWLARSRWTISPSSNAPLDLGKGLLSGQV